MSKNVAVFVDVANIFYAAKAAGTDIDYVTLLKSATAGRDFVRAYAYTGLDPENENQRQFHAFLARNGYKVISKDIRKYGDGRIKANLDIELVVDMMRMARNLDIAVVVSGDGDFAPAIRAVQQMGVRVEVISFRGNTSSDLIEVADTFTDIAQIARVEKGSARSGRRVAAEGDLSMTEVPEKETEGAPRRRRGARVRPAEAEERPVAAADTGGLPANLIVLPGERLSRAPDDLDQPAVGGEGDGDEELAAGDLGSEDGATVAGDEGERRRRRRRGGRGRGRGRAAGEGAPADEPVAVSAVEPEELEEEQFEEVGPAQLPHHTFGSVWDTQLGVPSAPLSVATGGTIAEDDEDYEDEPEIPEYLLAERRQRGQQRGQQRGRMGGGRGRGAGYQAAVERERYGRGGAPGFGGAARPPERQRPDRSRGGRPPQGPRPGRPPERGPREQRSPERQPGAISGVPWSEVPPEVEELLRAELARHTPPPAETVAPTPALSAAEPQAPVESATPKPRAPRRRTAAASTAAPETEARAAEATTTDKPARAPRRRSAAVSADTAPAAASAETPAEAPSEAPADAAKPRRTTRTRKASSSAAESGETAAATPAAEEASAEPARPVRRRRTKPAEDAEPQG